MRAVVANFFVNWCLEILLDNMNQGATTIMCIAFKDLYVGSGSCTPELDSIGPNFEVQV
jgi:hypothetical protein